MSARDHHRSRERGLRRLGVAGTPRIPVFHVFVEGSVTEPEYVERLREVSDVAGGITIKVHHPGNSPRPIVNAAVAARDASADGDIHQFWAVFDVEAPDPHGDLSDAMSLARHHDLPTAVSNPCVELWLLLHTGDQDGYLDSTTAESRRRAMDGSKDKHLTERTPVSSESVSRACARSRRLRQRHKDNGTVFPDDNPSSGMDLLISAMREVSATRRASRR
ncbi:MULTISPECIES: RloB family protein [unclassified Actinomyces]|uniref:RloB family protein n=1 Tax=unclassified Actinomyces TaxID=2609248 RepID=UPI002016C4D7|nr:MULTISPECIES: RloB family protein [unclassified Actinomyces]MCL3776827.1 RloB domain-containing protein [Actinomyces sp. AC-20-1]MCL3790783.1 RloB domain-containing protein [Actinomyces sp. 187325]MCL3793037.1 RloB domain-containing protein [Actinomyces sp. 186855]MCL3795472.1 RloB domain-containing protein [Actinomyces sp. 217892]